MVQRIRATYSDGERGEEMAAQIRVHESTKHDFDFKAGCENFIHSVMDAWYFIGTVTLLKSVIFLDNFLIWKNKKIFSKFSKLKVFTVVHLSSLNATMMVTMLKA